MSKIVITSTPTTVTVEFGDYADLAGYDSLTERREKLSVNLWADVSLIEFTIKQWGLLLTYNLASTGYKVDSIDGVAPTSNEDLYNKLSELVT